MSLHIHDKEEKADDISDRLRVNLSAIDASGNAEGRQNFDNTEGGAPGSTIHPGAAKLFQIAPWAQMIPIFNKSCEGYGPKCTVGLSLVYFFSKGIANNLLTLGQYAMFINRFGVSGMRYQRLASIAKMGWSIKAFAAMLSDSFALFGYTKRWYCAFSCILGAALTFGYASLPMKESSADVAAGFVFLISFSIANVDILSEGHYSRLMRRRPDYGPSLVSWIWWFILTATIVAALIQGPLSDHQLPHVGLYIAGGAQLLATVFFCFNWYGEKVNCVERAEDLAALQKELTSKMRERTATAHSGKGGELTREPVESQGGSGRDTEGVVDYYGGAVEGDELYDVPLSAESRNEGADMLRPNTLVCLGGIMEFNKDFCLRNWRVLAYSVLMTCSVVVMTCVTILGSRWDLLYSCIAIVVACAACAFWALPLVIAKVSIYFFCYALFYLQLSGSLEAFYLATPECLQLGPHFSFFFYNTISSVIGNVAGIAAVAAFPYLFAKHSLRFTLMFTFFLQILASLFDLIIVKRWNIYIGIPDHAMYLFGDAVIYQVSHYLAWMPTVVLLSRICPRGSESMMYALVAGFGNLGASMSSILGSLLMEFVWPVATQVPCDFSNVQWLVLVGHILLPMIIVPLSFLLIPSARVCDDIDEFGNAVRKETSAEPRRDNASEPIRE